MYLHQWALAFVSASCRVLHSFANSNPDTFACAIDVRVSLTHNISLAPLDPMRATEIFCFYNPIFQFLFKRVKKERKKKIKKNFCCFQGRKSAKETRKFFVFVILSDRVSLSSKKRREKKTKRIFFIIFRLLENSTENFQL